MKRPLGGVLVLALASCAAEVGSPDEVGESPEAMVATVPTMVVQPGTIPPFKPEPVEPAPDLPGIPKWKAYIGAPKGRHARYGGAATRPDLVDEHAYIVLVPPPGEGPEQMIPLFLRQAWRYGDLYFERMTSQMRLTPADWIGILLAIGDLEEHPKLLPPTHGLLVVPTFEEDGGGLPVPPPPPLPGDDHRGPGPTIGGGRTGGGGTPTPPHPPPPGPDDTSPPPLPSVPPGMEHAAQDGIFPGDWPYAGWVPPNRPEDADYTPQPGELEHLIRCEGHIYVAYKSNCVDFQPKTPGVKWTAKIGNWIGKAAGDAWDSLRASIHHNVWHDGKNPQCSEAAVEWAEAFCSAEGLALLGVCTAIPSCYAWVVAGGAFSVGAGFLAGGPGLGKCTRAYSKAVIERICVH